MIYLSTLPFTPLSVSYYFSLLPSTSLAWHVCLSRLQSWLWSAGQLLHQGPSAGLGVVAGGYQGPGCPQSAFLCVVAPSHQAHGQM